MHIKKSYKFCVYFSEHFFYILDRKEENAYHKIGYAYGMESDFEKEKHVKYNRSVYQALTMIGQFGINMLVPVLFCSFLGMLLDKKLGTDFIVILLFFVGAVSGGYNVYRFSRRVFARESEQSAYLHKGRKAKETNEK